MAEEAKEERVEVAKSGTRNADVESSDPVEANRPSTFAFTGILLGGWLALMIVFTVIAAVAMTIVGAL